ncbi:MAG: choice-of-anchor D domain-containing protein, partial [Deltaproteobacteria bacterium]|nr:choice-of-anchor D domain-containing protein [Deltaproteobacteria bacterium]
MGRAGWALGVALVVACGCDRRWVWSAGGEWSLGPAEVDFGAVQVGGTAHRSLQLTNDGRTPLTVLSVGGAAGPFALSGVAPGDVLPPASSRPVTLTFAPGAEVAEEAELLVEVDSPGTRAVRARGVGGQARLEASPLFVDFGSVELPGRASQQVVLRNAGNVAAEPLLALGGDAPDAFSVTSAPGVLLPGEERPVGLLFHPLQLGLARAGLEVRACAACPPLEVGLQGMGSAGIVSVAPQRLDFGRVPVGNTAVLKLSVSHNGTTPLTFLPPVIQGTAAAPFTVLSAPALPGDQLLPGMVVEVVVQFAPAAAGKVAGAWLRLPLKASNTDGRVDVPLSGEGGGGCVLVLPRELDFGTVPQGMTVTQRVDVLNRCAAEVALTDLQVLGATGGYFSLVQGASSATVPVGGVRSLRVAFTPRQGETAASATLALKAWEGSAPYGLAVPLRAQSRVFAPCAASLTPQALDFGGVQVGTSTSLGVAVTNTGADDCVVSGLSLVAGSDSAFQVTPADAVTLRPGESRQLQVAFAPASPQDQSGLAELFVNDPAGGLRQVPLSGTGVLGCLTLAPPLLDFGARMLSCGGRSLALTARNTCSGTALLQQALLAPGGSPEFALGAGPALPLVLQAGQAVTFPVSYQPTNAGADGAAFQLHTGSGPPLTAGVRGEAVLETEASELFVQEARAR